MADRNIKITTSMPEGDANGLTDPDVVRELFDDPTRMRVAIVIFNAPKSESDDEKGVETRKVAIRRIEVILSDTQGDATALERLLTRAYERRTGATVLGHELEGDVRAAFDSITIDNDEDPGV